MNHHRGLAHEELPPDPRGPAFHRARGQGPHDGWTRQKAHTHTNTAYGATQLSTHRRFLLSNLRHSIPTLFLSECVLIYMKDEHSSAVIRQIRNYLSLSNC